MISHSAARLAINALKMDLNNESENLALAKLDQKFCYKNAEKGSYEGEAAFIRLNRVRNDLRTIKSRRRRLATAIKELKKAIKHA